MDGLNNTLYSGSFYRFMSTTRKLPILSLWSQKAQALFRPWFVVEKPQPQQTFSAWLDVRGWALSRDGANLSADIRANGTLIRRLTVNLLRSDVAAVYPHLPFSRQCGFETRLLRQELPDLERFSLRVVVYVPGALTRLIRRRELAIPVKREGATPAPVQRGDYRAVWNDAATSLEMARGAVIGSTDLVEYEEGGASAAATVAAETNMTKNDVVLEIGCGTGRIGVHVTDRCREWIGTDVSDKMLKYARAALAPHDNVRLVRLTGHDLTGLEESSVDIVYCSAVFMHLDEWDRYRYVTEAHRVLRRGGRMYFDNFNLCGQEGWGLFSRMSRIDPTERPPNISKSSTPEELRAYAEHAGFQSIQVFVGPLFVAVKGVKP